MGRFCSILPGAVLLALTVACGGANDASPAPSVEPAATSTPPRPAPTPQPTAKPATAEVAAVPTPRCPDPYPAGAPFQPTPGAPIRLQPIGSAPAIAPYQPIPFVRDAALERVMRGTLGEEDEHFGVYVKSLADGKGGTISRNRSFYAASLYKTWVLLEALHQRDAGLLDLDETLIVSDYYASLGLNSGELEACERVSVREAIGRMMSVSDNVAANLALDRVGAWNVNLAIEALGLGASGFVGGSLPTTAADMALLLEAVAQGQALNEASSGETLLLLGSEVVDGRLPALLPAEARVAHKTGSWDTATHDAGIVFSPKATYIIVVLTDYGYADGGAERIAELSRAVYDYYNR